MLDKLTCKNLLLVRSEILGLSLNTLTSNGKYSLHNTENFRQEFQTKLSEKRKPFSGFFIAVLKCTSNSEYFEKKDESYTLSISEIIDCERGAYVNV